MMDERLGSLARFAEVAGVYRTESIMVEDSWYQQGEALPVMVQYDGAYRSGLIRFSPHLDEVDVDGPHGCMTLSGNEFLSVLLWLIRQGLLEDVGLISTETAPSAGATHASPLRLQEDDGRVLCLCAVELAGETERIQAITDWGIEQEMARRESQAHAEQERGQRLVTMVADEASAEEDLDDPFHLPIFELEEGAGEPSWLEDAHMLRYLHHQLELSVTDIARLCETTYARVKSALHRLGIEIVSYRGGRSKIGPRHDVE